MRLVNRSPTDAVSLGEVGCARRTVRIARRNPRWMNVEVAAVMPAPGWCTKIACRSDWLAYLIAITRHLANPCVR